MRIRTPTSLGSKFHRTPSHTRPRYFLFRRCLLFAFILAVLYIFVVYLVIFRCKSLANNNITINHVNIPLPQLHTDLDGLTFAQISDIHFQGEYSEHGASVEMIKAAITAVNNAQVDFVLLTGDFVDYYPEQIDFLTQIHLSRLKSRLGSIAVLGNHDYQHNYSKHLVVKALQSDGIHVLINEVFSNNLVEIIGIGDYWTSDYNPERAMKNTRTPENKKILRIVLSHNPDTAVDLKEYSPHLILSGHTHGGKYCLPPIIRDIVPFVARLPNMIRSFIPSSNLLDVVRHWEWSKGLSELPSGSSKEHEDPAFPVLLYTNTGLSRDPFRFWCRPEITIFHIVVK